MNHQIDNNDLAFLENRHGKFSGWIPGNIDQKTGKINPHVTTVIREDGKLVSVFHVKPVYYETPEGYWRPLSEVTLHHGNHSIILNENWWKIHPRYLSWLDKRCKLIGGELLIPSTLKSYPTPYTGIVRMLHESLVPPHMGLTTSTFYPDPHPETTTVDGKFNKEGFGTWSDIRDSATSGSINDDSTDMQSYVGNWNPSSDYYWCYRSCALFDTSSIGSDTVDSGTVSFYNVQAGINEDLSLTTYKSIRITTVAPASNTGLAVGDYDSFGTTAGSTDYSVSGTSANAYADFSLNGTGLSWVATSGVTKIGIRHVADCDNITPDAPGSADDYNGWLQFRTAEQTGTSNDPKLVVVHTAGATATYQRRSNLALLGVS